MKEAGFLEEVRSKSDILLEKLQLAFQDHPKIFAVRGLGMMIGIETSASLSRIVEAARQKGLIILTAGENVIRPPAAFDYQHGGNPAGDCYFERSIFRIR